MSIIQLTGSGDMTPAADPDAASLVTALPLNFKYGIADQSFRIRGTGGPATVTYTSYAYQPALDISSEQFKFSVYGSSAKEPETNPAGTTFHLSEIQVDTGAANTIGTKNYCYECWFYTEDFLFAGQVEWDLNYNGVLSNPSFTAGDVPKIIVKGDNWPNTAPFRRGIAVFQGTVPTFVFETTAQCLTPNTWHHIAVTRSGTTARIFVDGTLRASGTDSRNYAGYVNTHGVCNRTLGSGLFFQDLRVYVNAAKYTSNFVVPGSMFT